MLAADGHSLDFVGSTNRLIRGGQAHDVNPRLLGEENLRSGREKVHAKAQNFEFRSGLSFFYALIQVEFEVVEIAS